uniref:Mitochondrial carrier n=1 Tax=Timema bartmani TaxID=61472 RepID=A0A7R9EUJ2_9NEOP|nr:unnamed protein product [Timema bartmani]
MLSVLYIKSVDGFVGIYRGLAPKLCSNVISGFTFHKVSEALRRNTDDKNERYVEDELSEEQRREKFARTLASDVAAQTAAIIASQPFNVIAVRMMAQFVGAEKIYSGVLSSIGHIYHEEGLLGFFSGLMPRLLGELVALVISSTITYFINSYIISDRELHTYTMATSRKKSWREPARELYCLSSFRILMKIVPTFLDRGLLAGSPPHMALYESWTDCWSHLSRTNQLKRGSSMLWRYYTGPQVVIQGRAMPVNTDSFFKQL